MNDHLDLEAIKEQVNTGYGDSFSVWVYPQIAADLLALISEVERLRTFELTAKEANTLHSAYWTGNERALDDVIPIISRITEAALSESPTETKGENG